MSGDGQGLGGDGADWLLAQLAGGDAPRRDIPSPPVAPPAQPAQQVAPAAPAAPRTPAPRREEVLDWFSEAPAPRADATSALPVVGSPAPRAAEAPQQPSPVADAAAAAAHSPSWTPPFAVGLPHQPPAAAPVYLTSVEPPVGTPVVPPAAPAAAWPPAAPVAPNAPAAPAAPASPAAAWPPVAPAAPAPAPAADWPPVAPAAPTVSPTPAAPIPQASPAPASPEAPTTPPGPVTPTAPFALTWGGDEALSNEDAIRAAFRGLSEPTSTPEGDPRGRGAAWPAEQASPAEQTPPAEPEAPAESPFAGFAPPPVARQSFTPVPPAESGPPVHPTAPTTAPAGWGTPSAAPATPASYDDELWAALNEPEQPAAPARPVAEAQPVAQAPSAAPMQPAPQMPPVAQPVAPVAPEAPLQAGAPRPERDRFAAFAADTTDPFAALTETRAVPIQSDTTDPFASHTQTRAVPTQSTPAPPEARPVVPQYSGDAGSDASGAERESRSGFPFLEVRGMAAAQENAAVGAPVREASAFNTTPFPAFASATGGGDDPTREPPAPVDDLLASLGGGAPRARLPEPTPPSGGAGATPPTPPAPPASSGLDALGLAFGDEDEDEDDADARADATDEREASGIRGRFFGGARLDDESSVDRGADGDTDESSIAREMADTGYFWNLTPDPNAEDPKDTPSSVATAFLGEAAAVGPAAADEFAVDDAYPAWHDESGLDQTGIDESGPEAEPEWAFPGDPEVTGPESLTGTASYGDDFRSPPPAASDHGASDDDAIGALFGSVGIAAAANDPFAAPYAGQAAATSLPATPAQAPVNGGIGPQRTGGAGNGTPGSGGGGGSDRGGAGGGGSHDTPKGGKRTTRTLIWVAGGLVVLLVLAGLYYLGTQLTGGGGQQASGSPSASTSETPVAAPTAAQPPGVHSWDTLFGGECVDPFESVWADEFTVVDCTAPHAAQLVYRGTLPGDAAAPFPGEAALEAEMPKLCRATGVFDPALVAGIPDLQVTGSYPVEAQWADGQRTYYCFANRAGGEQLTGPINGPGPAV